MVHRSSGGRVSKDFLTKQGCFLDQAKIYVTVGGAYSETKVPG